MRCVARRSSESVCHSSLSSSSSIVFILLLSILIFAVLPVTVIAASSSYSFSELKAGQEYAQRVTDPQIPVQEFSFRMNKTVKDVSLELLSFTALPQDVVDPRSPKSSVGGDRAVRENELVYRYLLFKRSAGFIQNRLNSFTFELVVPQSWLEKNGVARDTVRVLAYDTGLWVPVDITYRGEDTDAVIYTVASLPTLYVILGKQGSVLAPVLDQEIDQELAQNRDAPITGAAVSEQGVRGTTIAGALLIFIIISLVIVAFAYQSKKEKQQGSQKVIPAVSELGAPGQGGAERARDVGSFAAHSNDASDDEGRKKPFMLSDDELQKNREKVRRELGL